MQTSELFSEYRPLLFSIAYRMTGTVMDAEDILQETHLRWLAVSGPVENPRAYLSAIVTRLCIDYLRSARVQRETYPGPWLPEPLMTETTAPLDPTMLAETLSTAFLVLLENLNPVERAVYLLREVFDYDYDEIARIVEKSEANCRQIFSRARRYVTERRPRFEPAPAQELRLLGEFMQVLENGEIEGFINMLSEDIVVFSDGGGKAFAARKPVEGRDLVTRFFLGIFKQAPPGLVVRFARSNGLPAIVNYIDGLPHSVLAFYILDGRIQRVYAVLNPDKLTNIPTL